MQGAEKREKSCELRLEPLPSFSGNQQVRVHTEGCHCCSTVCHLLCLAFLSSSLSLSLSTSLSLSPSPLPHQDLPPWCLIGSGQQHTDAGRVDADPPPSGSVFCVFGERSYKRLLGFTLTQPLPFVHAQATRPGYAHRGGSGFASIALRLGLATASLIKELFEWSCLGLDFLQDGDLLSMGVGGVLLVGDPNAFRLAY